MDNGVDQPDNFRDAGHRHDSPDSVVLMVAAQLVGRRGGVVEPLSDSAKSGFAVRLDDKRLMHVEINPTADLELESFASFLDLLVEELQYFNQITVSRICLSGEDFDATDPHSMQIDEPTASIVLPADMFSRAKSQPFARSIDTLSLLSDVDRDPSGMLNRYVVDVAMVALGRHQLSDTYNGVEGLLIRREKDLSSLIRNRTDESAQHKELTILARNGLDAVHLWPLVYLVGRFRPGADREADLYATAVRGSVALRQVRPIAPLNFPFD